MCPLGAGRCSGGWSGGTCCCCCGGGGGRGSRGGGGRSRKRRWSDRRPNSTGRRRWGGRRPNSSGRRRRGGRCRWGASATQHWDPIDCGSGQSRWRDICSREANGGSGGGSAATDSRRGADTQRRAASSATSGGGSSKGGVRCRVGGQHGSQPSQLPPVSCRRRHGGVGSLWLRGGRSKVQQAQLLFSGCHTTI